MLVEVQLKNFKCFHRKEILPVAKLNLLTGINGQGKSTVLQSILLFAQTVQKYPYSNDLNLNGYFTRLGGYDDVLSAYAERSSNISLRFEFEDDFKNYIAATYTLGRSLPSENSIEYEGVARIIESHFEGRVNEDKQSYVADANDKYIKLLPEKHLTQNSQSLFDLIDFSNIHFIAADRSGPATFHPSGEQSEVRSVGRWGEHAVDMINKYGSKVISDPLRLETGDTYTLRDQVSAWISEIFKGGKVQVDSVDSTLKKLSLNADGSRYIFKPENVGFGFSYSLPIVVAGLIADKGNILIVENPEAHLHPAAQNRLLMFLARVAASGVQVFVETHSQNILNASRIAIKDEILASNDVNVLYFHGEEPDRIKKVSINSEGKIESWPKGFFDQSDKEIEEIHGVGN